MYVHPTTPPTFGDRYSRSETFWKGISDPSSGMARILTFGAIFEEGSLIDLFGERVIYLRFWLIRNPRPVDGKCGFQSIILENRIWTRSRSGSNYPSFPFLGKKEYDSSPPGKHIIKKAVIFKSICHRKSYPQAISYLEPSQEEN